MSYQKCPVCDGTGTAPCSYVACTSIECPTCKGARIISEITGLPPEWSDLKTVEPNKEDIIRAEGVIDRYKKGELK